MVQEKDGVLRIVEVGPNDEVDPTEMSAREFVAKKDQELTRKGAQRRALFRRVKDRFIGTLAAVGALDGTIHIAERLGWYDPDADQKLLERLFFDSSCASGSLILANHHPFKLPPKDGYYPNELENCGSYRRRFLGHASLKTVDGIQNVRPEDSVVLFGSQVSNLTTRWLLGNPFGLDQPNLEIGKPELGWKATLNWNLHTPRAAKDISRQQFGAPWVTKDHLISDATGRPYGSKETENGLADDYLLITALPRFSKGPQRIMIFAGCHGPAQRATSRLLDGLWASELARLDKELEGNPYYQALFHVDVKTASDGELVPRDLEFVESAPITLTYTRR